VTWQSVSEGIAQARREMSARERRDVTGEEIAAGVGVTPAAYSRWERGERTPSEAWVQKLAKFFGVTPAYLRYGVPEAQVLVNVRSHPDPDAVPSGRRKAEGE
jgi:transcriptional regulator with XRE-family HTH domain